MWWVFGKEDSYESGSKPEESDSWVGSMYADSEPIGRLLLLKTLGPHSWVRVGYFSKTYPKRLSPARPVWVQTQPVATLYGSLFSDSNFSFYNLGPNTKSEYFEFLKPQFLKSRVGPNGPLVKDQAAI